MFESKEDRIVERIKENIKNTKYRYGEHINVMLRDGQILDIFSYYTKVNSGKLTPQDPYVYIGIGWYSRRLPFRYPFLAQYGNILKAYLSKLGFYYQPFAVPATGLKYVAVAEDYRDHLSIEVSNLDTVVNNLNLPKIVVEVLGAKLVSGEKELTRDEYDKIDRMFLSQLLFAGHNLKEARSIITDYYVKGNKSLSKEVSRIAMDYYKIFNSYRVCYDMDSWKEVDCWSIR